MNKTHGLSKSRLYRIWNGMMMRCYNPRRECYPRYGGRGIKVCIRWHKFDNFLLDMGPTYMDGLTLERNKVNKGYCKSNCKWIPFLDQSKNRSNTIKLSVNGRKLSIPEWSTISGESVKLIYQRIKNGWSARDCIYGRGNRRKLSSEQTDMVFFEYKKGTSKRAIGRLVGVSHSRVTSILQSKLLSARKTK